jgi:hypothetical protein
MCVLLKSLGCPAERVPYGLDEEVPRFGILLDLSSEGALEPAVAGSSGPSRPWAMHQKSKVMSTSVPGLRYQLPGWLLTRSTRCVEAFCVA